MIAIVLILIRQGNLSAIKFLCFYNNANESEVYWDILYVRKRNHQ